MFKWFENRKIKGIINKYSDSQKLTDLILDILVGEENHDRTGEFNFEDECVKLYYIYDGEDDREYKIWIKFNKELILVFHRLRSEYAVNVKMFKIGYWIYHLYRIKNKLLTLEETFSPELQLDKPTEEINRLMKVE